MYGGSDSICTQGYHEIYFEKMSYHVVFCITDEVVFIVGVFHDLEDYAKKVL